MKYIKYTHAAYVGYDAGVLHILDEVVKKEGIERTKMLFTPIDFKWEDLELPKVKDKKETTNKRNK